jgi:hypothetical protein
MNLEDTFLKDEVRVHRRGVTRKNIVGLELCGPVVDSFVWHVYAKLQEEGKPERTFRTFLSSLESPKERIAVLEEWETYLERERSPKRADGSVIEERRVSVVVESFSLIGSR